MRNIYLSLLLVPLFTFGADQSNKPYARSEQAEIESVLREIEYLRERVQALEKRYGKSKNRQKIRFNYRALLDQLRATESGIRDYLNARIDVIHVTPPQPLQRDLYQVRPN